MTIQCNPEHERNIFAYLSEIFDSSSEIGLNLALGGGLATVTYGENGMPVRPHGDIDLGVVERHGADIITLLSSLGYRVVKRTSGHIYCGKSGVPHHIVLIGKDEEPYLREHSEVRQLNPFFEQNDPLSIRVYGPVHLLLGKISKIPPHGYGDTEDVSNIRTEDVSDICNLLRYISQDSQRHLHTFRGMMTDVILRRANDDQKRERLRSINSKLSGICSRISVHDPENPVFRGVLKNLSGTLPIDQYFLFPSSIPPIFEII